MSPLGLATNLIVQLAFVHIDMPHSYLHHRNITCFHHVEKVTFYSNLNFCEMLISKVLPACIAKRPFDKAEFCGEQPFDA